ncbi:MAG: gas vesicle protein K [Nanoarchaeota archaeon]|nr:gas vesicle protein K [Nanoarchaeota archaeon]
MVIKVDEDDLKEGLIGVVIAVVEIVRDTLELQVEKRIERGRLSMEQIERAGDALNNLNEAIEDIKSKHGIGDTANQVRTQLDNVVDDVINKMVNPQEWAREIEKQTTRL